MNCFQCGAYLPRRPASRSIIAGTIFIAAGLILVMFVRLAVVVLASVLAVGFGATVIRGALQARVSHCPSCGAAQRQPSPLPKR